MKWLKRLDSKNAFYPSHNVIIILLHHSLKEKKKEIEKWSGQVSLVPNSYFADSCECRRQRADIFLAQWCAQDFFMGWDAPGLRTFTSTSKS